MVLTLNNNLGKVKDKLVPVNATKEYGGVEV
jgi:hypothetical protein